MTNQNDKPVEIKPYRILDKDPEVLDFDFRPINREEEEEEEDTPDPKDLFVAEFAKSSMSKITKEGESGGSREEPVPAEKVNTPTKT